MTSTAIQREAVVASARHTKFSVTAARSALREALTKLVALVPNGKPSIPIVACLRLEVSETVDELIARDSASRIKYASLQCTDLDAWLTLSVAVQATGSGCAAIPARRLAEILGALPAAAVVTIAVDGTRATISAGRAVFEVAGMDPAEFPVIPGVEAAPFEVGASAFVSAISRVVRAASKEESRPAWNAVCLEVLDGTLVAVATDGRMVARAEVGAVSGSGMRRSLPSGAVAPLARLFGGLPAEAVIQITADDYRARFVCGAVSATTRLIDMAFPAYKAVVAQPKVVRRFICERELLADAVRRVASAVSSQTPRVVFALAADARELTLSSQSDQAGTATDVVELESRDAPDGVDGAFRIAAQPAPLLAALDAFDCERIEVTIASDRKPIAFRNAKRAASDLTVAVVSPIDPSVY